MNRPDFWAQTHIITWRILSYLDSCPDAKDTAEGIAQWWLREEEIDVNIAIVRSSLASLVKWGWLMKTGGRASLTRYGLNKTRQHVLRQFLQRQSSFH